MKRRPPGTSGKPPSRTPRVKQKKRTPRVRPRKLTPLDAGVKASHLEMLLFQQIMDLDLPQPVWQFQLYDDEGDYDFAWPRDCLIVEVDGGIWMPSAGGGSRSGGHAHPSKIVKANAKRNKARAEGWTVFQVDTNSVNHGTGVILLKRFFERRRKRENR